MGGSRCALAGAEILESSAEIVLIIKSSVTYLNMFSHTYVLHVPVFTFLPHTKVMRNMGGNVNIEEKRHGSDVPTNVLCGLFYLITHDVITAMPATLRPIWIETYS